MGWRRERPYKRSDRRKAVAVIQVRGTVRAVDEVDGFQRWLGVTINRMRIHEPLWVRKKW